MTPTTITPYSPGELADTATSIDHWTAGRYDPADADELLTIAARLLATIVSIAGDPRAPVDGQVGRDHPATSIRAARRVPNRVAFGGQRWRIMRLLSDMETKQGMAGATAAQLADTLDMSRNQVATRLGECRAAGWVEYVTADGEVATAPTSAHAEGALQRLTVVGRVALATAGE